MLWLFVGCTGVYLLDCFALVFSFIYCWVLIFALVPCYILIYMFWAMMHWIVRGLSCKPNIYVSWSTSELRVRLVPFDRFKPSSKIFYWPFQGGTSFVDPFFFLSCVCYAFVHVCLYVPCGHLLGKGWPLGSLLWCPTVSWYPGWSVVLDYMDSWSLHPYLLQQLSNSLHGMALGKQACTLHWQCSNSLAWYSFTKLIGMSDVGHQWSIFSF